MFRKFVYTTIIIIIFSYILVGCGIRPQADFYLEPVASGTDQRVDEKANSVTFEHEEVTITATALDVSDLIKITSDPYANPYVYVGDWGAVKPLYMVFDVFIRNRSEGTFKTHELAYAVIMDEYGEQYEVIPYSSFEERFPDRPILEREIVYYRTPPHHRFGRWWRPWYYHYDRYWHYSPYYRVRRVYNTSYIKQAIARQTILRPVDLYPGGKRQGFLVFPLPKADSGRIKLIFPDSRLLEDEMLEFQFDIKPVREVKVRDEDKRDAGKD